MKLLLNPVDTFFFRDHLPMAAGEDSAATSIFPPRPGTIYGALRSAYIHNEGDFISFQKGSDRDLKKWMGTTDTLGEFKIKAVFLHDGTDTLLPLPFDYQVLEAKYGEKKVERGHIHNLQQNNFFSSDDAGWKLLSFSEDKSSQKGDFYCKINSWKKEMLNPNGVEVIRSENFLTSEPKIGIKRDWQTRRNQEGMLYQIEMNRFQGVEPTKSPGIIVHCENSPDFSEVKYARLGGRNRPWRISVVEEKTEIITQEEKAQIIQQLKETGIARIILLTQAIWKHGFRPGSWNKNDNMLDLGDGINVEVLTASIKRPVTIGGWDIARVRPKERVNAVPEGSVLYVKVQREQVEMFVEKTINGILTDELAHEGYGLTVCGSYPVVTK
ncbi:type III-B CRISPR module-associated protein Cmr3 [Candidatus Contubernalis alkaliaceticus]|uniref:type III-B CRISPR module-associated protein Cmr3 n=1 Tax=Candidatus Contubernalis alkaliaceticus TaxID=338645 RepID=UPI001F4BD4E3|nr:type III-B CRISPR module-associated protein Cmr3 [Candidatus Contubernalis alkalaceticus]UNC93167.1 type III-B CRISPR module-associated protein Cmr3 [Candidatus Contubernalis alkalaceticus]